MALRVALLALSICSADAARITSIDLTCPSTVNTFFPKEHRIDCAAFDSQSQDEDERRRICYDVGCCWSPLEHGSREPWCFSKPLCPAYIDPDLRTDCTDFESHEHYKHKDQDTRGRACESVGCCWQPLEEKSDNPWCFKPIEGDTAQRKSPLEEKKTPATKPDRPTEDKTLECGKYPGRHEKTAECINLQTDERVPESCCGEEEAHDDSAGHQLVVERIIDDEVVDDVEEVIPKIDDSNSGPQPGTVVVFVDRATNLPNTDSWGAGLTDAFVKVYVGGFAQHTSAISNSLSPQWNEKFTFDVLASDAIVKLTITDQDGLFNFWWNGHDHIQDLEVSFRGLSPGKEYMFTETVLPQGSIQFRLKWLPLR